MAVAVATASNAGSQLEQEDRLGNLSDDILICILNCLELKEAVRCSLVSRRWKHLPGGLPYIYLRVEDHEYDDYKHKDDDGFVNVFSSKKCSNNMARSNMAMVQSVKSILAHKSKFKAIPLLQLQLSFLLRDESIDIIRAVDDAIARGLRIGKAGFKISGEKIDYECDEEDLSRQGRRFLSFFNAGPLAFATLTNLSVESVKLGQSDVSTVLDTCKKLKRLSLQNCDSGQTKVLTIEHPHLTDLRLVMCHSDSIELRWLPELMRLTISCWFPSQHRDPLLFGHVPWLSKLMVRASYNTECRLLKLSDFLSGANMRELQMDFSNDMPWIQIERPKQLAPQLQNLRTLRLDNINEACGVTWTLVLLEAAPFLEKLHVKVSYHNCSEFEEEMVREYLEVERNEIKSVPSDFKHHNLAVLTIYGFYPGDMLMRYIRRVLEAAANLVEISLHDEWCEECDFYPLTRYPKTKKDRELVRQEINEGRSTPIKTIQFYSRLENGSMRIDD